MSFASLLSAVDDHARDVLGEDVVYTSGAAVAVMVRGIFDAVYTRPAPLGEAGVSSSGPAVFVALGELSSDPRTDVDATIMVQSVDYSVVEAEADGQGGVLLRLRRA